MGMMLGWIVFIVFVVIMSYLIWQHARMFFKKNNHKNRRHK